MAIIELQMNAVRFCEYVRGEINSRPLPYDNVTVMRGIRQLHPIPEPCYAVDRIECVSCDVDRAASTNGALVLNANIAVHYIAGLLEVYAAGSMQPPQTEVFSFTAPLSITLDLSGARPALRWEAQALGVADTFPLSLPAGLSPVAAAVVAGEGIIAVRIGTQTTDAVTAAPIENRLSGRDWNQLIPGQVFADILVDNLNTQLADAASADLVMTKRPRGSWDIAARTAQAWAEMTAVDACTALNIDVPVDFIVRCHLALNGVYLTTTVNLEWDPDSTWCEIVGFAIFAPFAVVIHNQVDKMTSAKVLALAEDPAEYEKTGQTATSITYERTVKLDTPARFSVNAAEVTPRGVELAGSILPRPGLGGLTGTISEPAWGFALSCSPEGAGVVWYPGRVNLHAVNGAAPPTVFDELTVLTPDGAWDVAYDKTAQASNELTVTFNDPPGGRRAAGTATRALFFTDCGIRWVDLGEIPEDQLSTNHALVHSMQRVAHERCQAISRPWGLRPDLTTIFQWMVDPLLDPDPDRIRTLGSFRLWSITIPHLQDSAHLTFVAALERDTAQERLLGTIDNTTAVAIELVTAADEVLAVRASETVVPTGLAVRQTWLHPISATAQTNLRPVGFRADDNVIDLAVVHKDSATTEAPSATDLHAFRIVETGVTESGGRVATVPEWARVVRLDRQTVAFTYGDQIVVAGKAPTVRIR